MKATESTMQQIQRAIRKVAEKFPKNDEAALMTDIHIRVSQDTGELLAFDDDDKELTRCVVEQWIDNKDDDFYDVIAKDIRQCIVLQKELIENLSILKPYSFVLENDDSEHVAELYVVDDDTVIIDPNLMEGLDEELNTFLEKLLKN
ncbi:hypothetical protein L6472_07245 [Prevotella sp. E13-17]|uniref:hypothetical protein n=1 Tax=Prevotella sp. E13-17 TaxID=2913616 RepID=UPI001EDB731D|nr:hypothetical protein [Prevotella sp. E13-17]UKK49852.1 hypothetical protein L6472_07245 [Prevotella sp. E13-17]